MNTFTNEKNMRELSPDEMELANGGSLLSWLTDLFITPIIKIYNEYEKQQGN